MFRLITLFLIFTTAPVVCQTKITWETLTDVRFSRKYFEEVGQHLYYPNFGASVKALEGEQVFITGYMLPMAPEENLFILSKFPFAECFFCGNSGPESIVELQLKPGHPKFRMDELVTIMGRLKLNQDNIDYCNYILEEAEIYEK